MIFTIDAMNGIAAGDVTLAFRRWATARVTAGSRQRNSLGVVEITSVDAIDSITDDEARAAGFRDAAKAMTAVDRISRGGTLFRIGVRYVGADPRHALRVDADLGPGELADLRRRLSGMDRGEPWTEAYLRLIAGSPGVVARELATRVGIERDRFKLRVRRLKDLGLTESLDVGYRISPRGQAVIEAMTER